jgi:hypothetical protein
LRLRTELPRIARAHPRWGWRMAYRLLRRDTTKAWSSVNHRRVQRLWRAEGLRRPVRAPLPRLADKQLLPCSSREPLGRADRQRLGAREVSEQLQQAQTLTAKGPGDFASPGRLDPGRFRPRPEPLGDFVLPPTPLPLGRPGVSPSALAAGRFGARRSIWAVGSGPRRGPTGRTDATTGLCTRSRGLARGCRSTTSSTKGCGEPSTWAQVSG